MSLMGGSENKSSIIMVMNKNLKDSLLTGLWLKKNNNL